MVESKNMRYQVRKSRQPDVPVIKFRSSCDACTEAKVRCDKGRPHCGRCNRIGGNCRYSVSMRTGKPAIEFVKALQARMPLALPLGFSSDRDATKNNTTEAHQDAADSDELIDALLQAAAAHNQSSSSSSNASTSPLPDLPHSLTLLQNHEMNPDPEPSLANSSPVLPSCPVAATAQQGSYGTNTSKTTPGMVAGHGPTPTPTPTPTPPTNECFEDMGLTDCFGTDAGAFDMGSVYSQPFSFSMTPTMDLDCFSHMDLTESDLQSCMGIPTPNLTETTPPNDGGAMAIDPALQQTGAALQGEEGHSCLRVAKRLQQSAIIVASKGETSEHERNLFGTTMATTTTDQALLMCSSARRQLIDILRCRCESDAYLPFLVTVLISKVLATYSAIAKAEDSTPFGFASSPRTREQRSQQKQQQLEKQMQTQAQAQAQAQTRQSRNEKPDAFVPVPLRLGAYEVEEDLEGLLRTQMVLYELSKMECVVQLFAEKYCHGIGAGNEEGLVEDCNVYTALCEFIKNRYARTRAICELQSPSLTK